MRGQNFSGARRDTNRSDFRHEICARCRTGSPAISKAALSQSLIIMAGRFAQSPMALSLSFTWCSLLTSSQSTNRHLDHRESSQTQACCMAQTTVMGLECTRMLRRRMSYSPWAINGVCLNSKFALTSRVSRAARGAGIS